VGDIAPFEAGLPVGFDGTPSSVVPAMPSPSTFTDPEWRILSGFWYPVAWSEDVQDIPIAATLLDEELVIFRTSGGVVVAKDICLHRGSRLTLGWLDGDELVCRYHGWRYGEGGRCTRIPSQPPDRKISPRARLFAHPAVERYGVVWTCLGEPTRGVPEWPEPEDPSYRWMHLPAQDWATSAARQIENFLDISHFSFVHRETFGNPDQTEMHDFDVETTPTGFGYRYPYLAANPGFSGLGGSSTLQRWMTYEVALPFSAKLAIKYPEKGERCEHVIFNCASPMSSKQVRIFMFLARNFDHDVPAQQIVDWDQRIVSEDRPVVESQRPEQLPLDLTEELHVQSDKMTIAYRRELAKLGLGPRYSR
jgi:phenylpropionate dioxygenase-like ring-hydroxylating dioxygenase large terminal subunit